MLNTFEPNTPNSTCYCHMVILKQPAGFACMQDLEIISQPAAGCEVPGLVFRQGHHQPAPFLIRSDYTNCPKPIQTFQCLLQQNIRRIRQDNDCRTALRWTPERERKSMAGQRQWGKGWWQQKGHMQVDGDHGKK